MRNLVDWLRVFGMVTFFKMGQLFKWHHVIQREKTESWAVALALAAYALGLSFRKTAQLLGGLGVPISHVAIWYWKEKFANNWRVWLGPLPSRIVVDETLVKVGGRKCWIFAAIDPATRRVLYLQAFRDRGLWHTCEFFQELGKTYGRWAQEAIVDGGPWYQGALWLLQQTQRVRMVGGIRNYVERFFRELKRRLKAFDVSFPQRRLGLASVRHWLKLYAWHYNQSLMARRFLASS